MYVASMALVLLGNFSNLAMCLEERIKKEMPYMSICAFKKFERVGFFVLNSYRLFNIQLIHFLVFLAENRIFLPILLARLGQCRLVMQRVCVCRGGDVTILRKSFPSVLYIVCTGSLSPSHSANLPSSISRTAYGKQFWRAPKLK